MVKPSSVSREMDFSAALAPAASGSKLTITFAVCRLRIATCCSVKAVPLVAITFWIPRRKTLMQSICPSTSRAKPTVRIADLALSRLKSTCPFE